MKYEPLKGKILLWNQITGDIETTDGKYFLETKTEDARFFRIFLEKDIKSAVQGLLRDVEKIKSEINDSYKNEWYNTAMRHYCLSILNECEKKVKKWFSDVISGEEK